MSILQSAILMVFPVALAFAAANDLFTMRIPNKISLALIGGFFAAALLTGTPLMLVGQYVGIALATLVFTFALFAFRLLGGGDAKLLAAAALWMGPDHVLPFLIYVTLFGGALSVLILAYRKLVPVTVVSTASLPPWAQSLHTAGTGIPYGIAIAAAGLFVYPETAWFTAFAQ